ncbi:pentatricopeptide repeat-containing protein [Tanacetum coccineum]
MEKAATLFNQMVEKGFASAHTYNTLIDGYCKLGKIVEADELLKDMIDNKHIKPNHVTFTVLIDCYCKAQMMEEAEDLFNEMQNRDLIPTIVTYTCLAHGYMRSGNKHKMISIIEQMVEKGISLDKVVYNMLDEDQDGLEKSFRLLDELLQKGLSGRDVYDKLIDGLCQNGKFSEAVASIDEIGKRGVMLSFATCSTLVHSLHSAGYKNKLAGVLKRMEGFGWVPQASSLTDLINQHEPDGDDWEKNVIANLIKCFYWRDTKKEGHGNEDVTFVCY